MARNRSRVYFQLALDRGRTEVMNVSCPLLPALLPPLLLHLQVSLGGQIVQKLPLGVPALGIEPSISCKKEHLAPLHVGHCAFHRET